MAVPENSAGWRYILAQTPADDDAWWLALDVGRAHAVHRAPSVVALNLGSLHQRLMAPLPPAGAWLFPAAEAFESNARGLEASEIMFHRREKGINQPRPRRPWMALFERCVSLSQQSRLNGPVAMKA